jgi:hypothetical protein
MIKLIKNEIENKEIFSDCILDGHVGLPLYEKYVEIKILENINKKTIFIVPSFVYGNYYLYNNRTLNSTVEYNDLFLNMDTDSMFTPSDKNYAEPIDRSLISNTDIAQYAIRVLDHIIQISPNIKFIFWCAYNYSKNPNHIPKSIPECMLYDNLKKRYANNTLDIDSFTKPEWFFEYIVRYKNDSHPSVEGYRMIDRMIRSF